MYDLFSVDVDDKTAEAELRAVARQLLAWLRRYSSTGKNISGDV
jgi:hypothetical protein